MLTLRPITPEDLPVQEGDSEYDDFGPRAPLFEPPPSRVDADGTLAIDQGGVLIGTIGWHWVHWGPNAASRNPMIGVWLAEEHRGHGIGSAAQELLVELLFRATNVNRIEAHTDVTNIAEQKALEYAGFRREGIIRGGQWRNGAWHDGWLYSILREDWRDNSA